jgi:dephospho-CoA kinase
MQPYLLVGVTGGIGSGKSLICEIFHCLGIPVYNADNRAKWLMNNDTTLKHDIKSGFGPESYSSDGLLNRSYLAKKVFNNERQLQKLNSLVHPAVGKDFKNWVLDNSTAKYLIKEAALIFESGSDKELDYIITVAAPKNIRIDRVIKRDPFRDRKQVEDIMERQLSDEERKELADYELVNDNQHMVIPQVLILHNEFTDGNN